MLAVKSGLCNISVPNTGVAILSAWGGGGGGIQLRIIDKPEMYAIFPHIQGYYTLSMHCEYQTVRGYIDVGILKTTSTSALCYCNVIGINENGIHSNYNSERVPDGTCRLRIKRCPTTLNII